MGPLDGKMMISIRFNQNVILQILNSEVNDLVGKSNGFLEIYLISSNLIVVMLGLDKGNF